RHPGAGRHEPPRHRADRSDPVAASGRSPADCGLAPGLPPCSRAPAKSLQSGAGRLLVRDQGPTPDPTWAMGRSQAPPHGSDVGRQRAEEDPGRLLEQEARTSATRAPRGGPSCVSEGAEWKQIFQIIDAAYADYLTGMAALRKRVVDDVSRKLNDDGAVPDHPRR